MIDAHEFHDHANHRRHYRAAVKGCAVVHARGGAARCRVGNVGLGGVLLCRVAAGTFRLEAGDDVTVEMEVAGAGWVVQRGRVLRDEDNQLAIRFDLLSPDVEDLIEDEVLGAVEAEQTPRVVVVDQSAERRSRIAEELRRGGCCTLEAATPLEAVTMVERSRNHVAAVAMAETQTQTLAAELAEYFAEAHPQVKVVVLGDLGDWVSELSTALKSR